MSRWNKCNLFNRRQLPTYAAVYAIYFDGELVYIGSTNCLRNRISKSGYNHFNSDGMLSNHAVGPPRRVRLAEVKYRKSKRYGEWAMAEIRLIRRIKPRLNKTHVRGRLMQGASA